MTSAANETRDSMSENLTGRLNEGSDGANESTETDERSRHGGKVARNLGGGAGGRRGVVTGSRRVRNIGGRARSGSLGAGWDDGRRRWLERCTGSGLLRDTWGRRSRRNADGSGRGRSWRGLAGRTYRS